MFQGRSLHFGRDDRVVIESLARSGVAGFWFCTKDHESPVDEGGFLFVFFFVLFALIFVLSCFFFTFVDVVLVFVFVGFLVVFRALCSFVGVFVVVARFLFGTVAAVVRGLADDFFGGEGVAA